ncbi:MAG: hypothetical protein QW735_04115 [archaeon]
MAGKRVLENDLKPYTVVAVLEPAFVDKVYCELQTPQEIPSSVRWSSS